MTERPDDTSTNDTNTNDTSTDDTNIVDTSTDDPNIVEQDDRTTELGRTEPEGEHHMSETASTTDPTHEPQSTDSTSALPVAEPTSALPVAEPTSALPVAEPTSALPVAEPTSTVPVAEPTSALPVAEPTSVAPVGEPEDPFRVEPDRPVPDDAVSGDGESSATATDLPQLGAPVPAWAPPSPVVEPMVEPSRPALVTVRRGPRAGTVVLGLLSLVVAAWVMASNLTDTDVSLRVFGPAAFGALGGLLLLVGLVGVLTGARRR